MRVTSTCLELALGPSLGKAAMFEAFAEDDARAYASAPRTLFPDSGDRIALCFPHSLHCPAEQ
jgi:hypothetical protein